MRFVDIREGAIAGAKGAIDAESAKGTEGANGTEGTKGFSVRDAILTGSSRIKDRKAEGFSGADGTSGAVSRRKRGTYLDMAYLGCDMELFKWSS